MFIDMILKTIPRSIRAAIALVVMLISLQQAFTGLQALILPGDDGAGVLVEFLLELVMGILAGAAFYYFQAIDDQPAVQDKSLETLNNYHEAEREEQRLRAVKATPVFSSHDGEIIPQERIQPPTSNPPPANN